MGWVNHLEQYIESLLSNLGVSAEWVSFCRLLLFIFALTIIAAIAFWVTKKIIITFLYKAFKKTSFKWDDLIVETNALNNIAHIVPAIFVLIMAPVIFSDFETILPYITKLTNVYIIIVGMTVVFAVMKIGEYISAQIPAFKDKPLTSYFQLVRIVLYIIAFILILSIVLEKSPIYFLSAFGAMTAIILLIFKDTILGLVASVQLSVNDMVRVGDWVEMPKFNADGDVLDINLNTVKVQNWDKTITTIPTYYFVTDSFKNWRGMQKTGGRRIKRSLYIDVHSVKLVDSKLKEKLKNFQLISDFIKDKESEIESYNTQHNIDRSFLINGRQMTNLGIFRIYVDTYLRAHPKIKQNMFIMVRHLAPESKGIPLEIYCFTDTVAWAEYEPIQADIFDHLFAVVKFFDLEIFQDPSGKDFTNIFHNIGQRTKAANDAY